EKPEEEAPAEEEALEEKQEAPEAIGDEEKQPEPEAIGDEEAQPEAEKPVEEKEPEEQAETGESEEPGVIEAEEAVGQVEEPVEHDEEAVEQDIETVEQAAEEYAAEDYAEYEYVEEPESEPLPSVKRRPRRKSVFKKYSVLIVPENSSRVKTYKVSALPFVIVGILLLAVAAAGIAGVNYAIRHIMDLRNQVIALNANLVNVTNANILLEADKETLENQLREANAKISTTTYFQEQAASLQAMDHVPSGLPLDGQASPPSEYTEEHQYITFNTGLGAKIVATGAGTVKSIYDDNSLGHVVQVDHGNGYISVYYSPSEPVVKEGDTVIRGTILYIVQGDTETLTYQITYNDKYIDPATIMRIDG
ncbi:MAG: M23 family metallopeptidase, partial [Lachnospiraceae bacterium]|nr:M23 family metallopeptidase [Lachnospiraceae bacterium]